MYGADVLFLCLQRLGLDFDERILPSIANEVLKSVVVSQITMCLCMYMYVPESSPFYRK
jgi:hypothetical protein